MPQCGHSCDDMKHIRSEVQEEKVLSTLKNLTADMNETTLPYEDPIGKRLTEAGFNVLSEVGYSDERPRWEKE